MTAVPLGEARNQLSEYVADVERTHERVTITRHGHPAAVLISVDDLASTENGNGLRKRVVQGILSVEDADGRLADAALEKSLPVRRLS